MNQIVEKLKDFKFINISSDENATIYTNVHKLTDQQKEDFSNQGIDIESMLISVQIDEMYQSISKKIIVEIANSSTKTSDINIDAMLIEQQREYKITEIFGEEKPERPIFSNSQVAQSLLLNNLSDLCNKLNPNVIITNGKFGSSIQDSFEFKTIDKNKIMLVSNPHYLIGSIFGCDVYVDAYMRYNDNRIFVCNVDLDLTHTEDIKWNDDFTELSFGYDIKTNPNTKVEVLNIIDNDMFLI